MELNIGQIFSVPLWVWLLCLTVVPLLAIEKEPLAEYRARRERLAERIKGNVLVLRAAPEQELSEYQQERNFYYLTGFDQPDAILLLNAVSDPMQEFLFIPERKLSEERWTGEKLGPGPEAAKVTGFANVLPVSEFDATLRKVSERARATFGLKEVVGDIASLRQTKSRTEIALLEKAIQITMKAQQAAVREIAPGAWEYEVEAALEFEFRHSGAERPAFPSIVGSGPFSTILHYNENTRRMESGDTVVVDIGAEYGGYTADVTRTYPVSGKFSPRQREIYKIVLDAQKAAIAKVKPGVTISEIHQAAKGYIESKGYGKYFIHGTSHHIGLEVHDVGATTRPLEANMVITVEPGIYIPEEKLGIRIEDDVLVTPAGCRLLSTFPKELDEIEALVRK
ncbi:MAG TPA: Xaa-Pro peptidase family protein [Terriglobia bacterium]|nr:Xaa-Pro peptidase family protein [Terriglobia bacterium]